MAKDSWAIGCSPSFNPSVSTAKIWEVFSLHPTYHKVTYNLDEGFYSSLGSEDLKKFICKKRVYLSLN